MGMIGRQLIEWIQQHDAYDKIVVVQYRDGGGYYSGGEEVNKPVLAECRGYNIPYSEEYEINYASQENNAIVL